MLVSTRSADEKLEAEKNDDHYFLSAALHCCIYLQSVPTSTPFSREAEPPILGTQRCQPGSGRRGESVQMAVPDRIGHSVVAPKDEKV